MVFSNQLKSPSASVASAEPFSGPLFLVGMPRSGTKLLRDLMNQHPRIFIPDVETEFLPYLVKTWPSYEGVHKYSGFVRFYKHIARFPYFIYRYESGALVNARDWFEQCRSFTPAGVFEALARIDSGAGWNDDHIWGDKSPSYINHLALIAGMYPDARIIHIVRDVRDYCLSIHRAWGKNMFRAAQRWADDVTRSRQMATQLGARYLEVKYEDLLGDVEGTMKRVCSFLGLAYDPSMLSLSRPSENIGNAAGKREIIRDNTNNYLESMDRRTLATLEKIAGNAITELDYELTSRKGKTMRLSWLQMAWFQFWDAVNLVRSERRERGLLNAIYFHIKFYLLTRA